MAPANPTVNKQQEQALRKLATDEEVRQKARAAFDEVASGSQSLDVLERCKRLNEFLSQDYGKMAKNQGELQHILQLLTAKNTNRPACLDKPSALCGPSSTSITNTFKVPAKPKRSLADSAADKPRVTSGMADSEAYQLLTLLEEAEQVQGSAQPAQDNTCSNSGQAGAPDSRPGSSSSACSHASAGHSVCSSAQGEGEGLCPQEDDDLISLFNPTSTPVPNPPISTPTVTTQPQPTPLREDAASRARQAGASKLRELQQRMLQQKQGVVVDDAPLVFKACGSLSFPQGGATLACTQPQQPSNHVDDRSKTNMEQRIAEEAERRAARMVAAGVAAAAEAGAKHEAEQAALALQRQKEEEARVKRQHAEEAARLNQQQEEAARQKMQQAGEALRIKRVKQQEEEAAQKRQQQEEEAAAALALKKKQQEEVKKQQQLQLKRAAAALSIQRHWRGLVCWRCFQAQCQAVVKLQTAIRVHQAVTQLKVMRAVQVVRQKLAARTIQRAWRKWRKTRGWQLGQLKVPAGVGTGGRRASEPVSNVVMGTAAKRVSDGELQARPLRVRSTADTRLAPDIEAQPRSSPVKSTAAGLSPVPTGGTSAGGVGGDKLRLRRALSATRERSDAVAAEEEVKRLELGVRVMMSNSLHRTNEQAMAIATQRAPAKKQREQMGQLSLPRK